MLKNVLTSDLVATDVEAKTWREAVTACGSLLVGQNLVEEGFIAEMIKVVEEFGPYMILVPEVAFFHGPPSELVKETALSLIALKEPIYFTEYTGQKVSCAFGFGAIDKDSHLGILMALSSILQNEEFIEMITHNADKASIMRVIEKY